MLTVLATVVARVLVASSLAAEPSVVEEGAGATAWTHMGARSWRLCRQLEEQANAALRGPSATLRSDFRQPLEACPQVPALLVLAVRHELSHELPRDLLRQHAPVAPSDEERRHRWLAWLERAEREAARQGRAAPPETTYLKAYVLMGLGEAEAAQAALAEAVRRGEVERWRSDRMFSAIAILQGQLERALRLSFRSVVDAPLEDQLISRYIWAWVLDRAGAPAGARQELDALRREAGALAARSAVETILPLHERLYFRALVHRALGDGTTAVALWEAYLRHREPAEPERELARRHLAELRSHEPRSGNVPDEDDDAFDPP